MRRSALALYLILAMLVSPALAALTPLDMGDSIPSGTAVTLGTNPDVPVAAGSGWLICDLSSATGAKSVEVILDTGIYAEMYLYTIDPSDSTVTQITGPKYLRDFMPGRNLVEPGGKCHAIQYSVTDTTTVIIRGR